MARVVRVRGLSLLAGLVALGCGGGRSERSGTVTVDGAPLPYGEINFSPDSAKGGKGGSAAATIRDGKFRAEAGAVGPGFYEVRITGSDAPPPAGAVPSPGTRPPSVLVRDYKVGVEFPAGSSEHRFDIPRQVPAKPGG